MKLPNGQYTEEAELLADVKDWLDSQRRCGVRYMRVVDRYTRGYSDIIVNAAGRMVVLELKDNIGTATPHQEEFIRDMLSGGATGGVCRTMQEVINYVHTAMYCKCATESSGRYCSTCGKLKQ